MKKMDIRPEFYFIGCGDRGALKYIGKNDCEGVSLSDFIILLAGKFMEYQREDGSFPAGHNGPYFDPETPLRNTGYWLITLSKCYRMTGKKRYIKAVRKAADFLRSSTARPHDYSFHHRNMEVKDKCNGLIGQAWTFEALSEASRILGDSKYSKLGEEVFLQHNFNRKTGLWDILEIDGNNLGVDPTFNHQLWFATFGLALGSQPCGDGSIKGGTKQNEEIKDMVEIFMDRLYSNLIILKNGLIYHLIDLNFNSDVDNGPIKNALNFIRPKRRKLEKKILQEEIPRSIGYHSFNMYAFGILKQLTPDHPFWNSNSNSESESESGSRNQIKKAIVFMESEEHFGPLIGSGGINNKEKMKDNLIGNKYGFTYNPNVFESLIASYMLRTGLINGSTPSRSEADANKIIQKYIHYLGEQIFSCFDIEVNVNSGEAKFRVRDTVADPMTMLSRYYEVTRLPSFVLENIRLPYKDISIEMTVNV